MTKLPYMVSVMIVLVCITIIVTSTIAQGEVTYACMLLLIAACMAMICKFNITLPFHA